MNNYCTLFDSNYLTRGLALYNSLLDTKEDFILYVFCFDEEAYELLLKLNLLHMYLIRLADFETEDLLKVKKDRTKAEYCWTCTPFVIRHIIDKFNLGEATYLDADLFFFNQPSLLLEEFHKANKSVMITEHRYTPKYDKSKTSGIYCVQFMTFRADEKGIEVLQWWQDRCLEWCYNRAEDGKMGDQKYLDCWTTMFDCVHVLKHLGGGVAPWNVQRYDIKTGPKVDGIPIIFYHFHALRWIGRYKFDLSVYKLNENIKRHIYYPYLEALIKALTQVNIINLNFKKGIVKTEDRLIRSLFNYTKRILKGTFNVIHIKRTGKGM